MSQLSYTGGGEFATSRRGGYDNAALSQAKDMLQRLGSYQAASQSTGVPITVLRETFPNVRRSGFKPGSLRPSLAPTEPPKVAPLPPPVIIDNDRIARLVMATVAQRFRLKYADLKASRNGTHHERLARMIFVSNISYFTSWDIEKIAIYCGHNNPESVAPVLRRYEDRISEDPEDRATAKLIRDRIASRIVAVVGG